MWSQASGLKIKISQIWNLYLGGTITYCSSGAWPYAAFYYTLFICGNNSEIRVQQEMCWTPLAWCLFPKQLHCIYCIFIIYQASCPLFPLPVWWVSQSLPVAFVVVVKVVVKCILLAHKHTRHDSCDWCECLDDIYRGTFRYWKRRSIAVWHDQSRCIGTPSPLPRGAAQNLGATHRR